MAIMFESNVKTTFRISSGGAAALAAMKRSMTGRITALFDNSLYVTLGDTAVCIGSESLPMGPINIRTSAPAGTQWSKTGLRTDDHVLIAAQMAHVGNLFVLSMAGAAVWKPAHAVGWTTASLQAGLGRLDKLLPHYDTKDGLAAFTRRLPVPASVNLATDASRKSIALLVTALEHDEFRVGVIANATKKLIGLGPGLTPSGDDFLGGMMIALHAIGREEAATALWTAASPHVEVRTNAISAAHLRCAAAGSGHEALHRILNNLLRGEIDSLRDGLDRIDSIGHCSGWDALAGTLTVLRATYGKGEPTGT